MDKKRKNASGSSLAMYILRNFDTLREIAAQANGWGSLLFHLGGHGFAPLDGRRSVKGQSLPLSY